MACRTASWLFEEFCAKGESILWEVRGSTGTKGPAVSTVGGFPGYGGDEALSAIGESSGLGVGMSSISAWGVTLYIRADVSDGVSTVAKEFAIGNSSPTTNWVKGEVLTRQTICVVD